MFQIYTFRRKNQNLEGFLADFTIAIIMVFLYNVFPFPSAVPAASASTIRADKNVLSTPALI